MKTYKAPPMEHIYVTTKNMVDLANESGEEVESTFSMVRITAKPGDSREDVEAQYWSKAPERP
jgi:hypothetical protein